MQIEKDLPDSAYEGEIKEVEELETETFTDWKKEPSVEDLKQDWLDSQSDFDGHVSDVETWLDNLNIEGAAKPPKKEGRSQVQPKVIRKQAEWRYASLSEPFLSTPDMFNVRPKTFEDAKAAEQNALILNYQFSTKIGKIQLIDDYIRTLVDEGTAILKTSWVYEDEPTITKEPFFQYVETSDEEFVKQLQQFVQIKDSNPYEYSLLPPETQASVEYSLEQQVPYQASIAGYEEYEDVKVLKNYPEIEVCDYRNTVIDPTAKGNMDKAMFVIHSFTTSKAELRASGKYKNIDNINTDNNSAQADSDHEGKDDLSFTFSDDARKKIVAYEYWGFRDVDGEGKLKSILATYVGNTMIRMEENPFTEGKLPFVVAHYLPVRKSNYGEPDGELLEDNQRIIGAVTRGMIDIMARGANGQQASRKDALDITNKRKFDRGEDYEFNAHINPDSAFYMHKFDEIPNSAQIMLQMQNADAESLTGVKAFSSGLSGKALGNTATGIRSALDATAQRELGILRRAANGLTEAARHITAMNAVFLEEKEVVRITNSEFVQIRRDDLRGEFDLELEISTADADNAKAEELSFMIQTTAQSMGPDFTRIVLAKIAKLRKMPELAYEIENYQEPPPDPMQQQKVQLELELLKAQIANENAKANENNANATLDHAKAGTEQAKASNLGSDTDLKNLDYVEQDTGVKQQRDLQRIGEQAESNKELEAVKSFLSSDEKSVGNPTVYNGLGGV